MSLSLPLAGAALLSFLAAATPSQASRVRQELGPAPLPTLPAATAFRLADHFGSPAPQEGGRGGLLLAADSPFTQLAKPGPAPSDGRLARQAVGLVIETDIPPLLFDAARGQPGNVSLRGDGRITLRLVDPRDPDRAAAAATVGFQVFCAAPLTIRAELYDAAGTLLYDGPIERPPGSSTLRPLFRCEGGTAAIHRLVLSTPDRGAWSLGGQPAGAYDFLFAGVEPLPQPVRYEPVPPPPWKTNPPIADVAREIYVRRPTPDASAWVNVQYSGSGLSRVEIHAVGDGDNRYGAKRRWSLDNGRTWSPFEDVTAEMGTTVDANLGVSIATAQTSDALYDPAHHVVVSAWIRQTRIDQPRRTFYTHSFIRVSRDNGRTWGKLQLLRYEDGPDFNPDTPLDRGYLERNPAYAGQNFVLHSNGTLILPVQQSRVPSGANTNPQNIPVRGEAEAFAGRCFIGRWDESGRDYRWEAGQPVWLPRHVNSDSLNEPVAAELSGGRLLVIWRATNRYLNPAVQPGYKWLTVSDDGGKTLSEPRPLRYDDDSPVYSPGSIHQLVRHAASGRLYWIGNISPHPCRVGDPRYPLVIAELDEDKLALKKNTVTAIDDRTPADGHFLQLSNFCVLEDRERHHLEIYLTRAGMDPTARQFSREFWAADAYKYTLTFRPAR